MIWMLMNLLGSAQAQSHLAMAKPAGMDTWGYIDSSGKWVVDAKYRKIERFTEDGFANIYHDKEHFFIDPKGERLQTEASKFALKSVMGFGFFGFNEGLVPIAVKKKYGYMNTQGKVVIDTKYEWVTRFQDGLASARISKGNFVILDKAGTETKVAVPNLLEMRRFDNGLSPFKTLNKTFGYLDKSGHVVIQPTFKAVGYFVDGLAWAKTVENTVGYIDTKGEWVIKPTFKAGKEFSGGLARVKKTVGERDVWTFIDTKGNEVAIGGDAEVFKDFNEGLCKAKKGGVWGFFDAKGTWVIEPAYENVRHFKNGYAAVKKGGLWGFIDTKGKLVVDLAFDGVKDLEKTGL